MIRLHNVSKYYNEVCALQNINLSVQEGAFVVLKGVSGSGKSTILSLIAALAKPTEGEVLVDGENIAMLEDHFSSIYRRDNIGFIFQKYNLIAQMSVEQNIALPLYPLNLSLEEIEIRVDEVMQMFSIGHKHKAMVHQLSGGEQQRVAIARANVNRPKIILADEPTANLDKQLSIAFVEAMQKLKNQNKTIIIATHDPLFFHLDCVDSYISLEDGKIV